MKHLIEGYSQQLHTALDIASKANLQSPKQEIRNIVIAGMGGSGIGANLVQAWTADAVKVPITISKSYDIPAFVNAHTLFVACSFSGNTEETLSATEKAVAAGAHVVAITSGGSMGKLAEQHGFSTISIPGESKSPRASIGYSYVNVLKVLATYGLTSSDYSAELAASAELLANDAESIQKLAKELAAAMKGKLPIIYGENKMEAVVLRAQQQIAENSKHLSHTNVLPEMNHNELVGWHHPTLLFENSVTVLLRSNFDFARTSVRMDVCEDIFKKHSSLHVVNGKGNSLIEQAHYFINVLDWVSFYLAEENGVDPFPVEVIDFLKNELAKHN